MERLHATIIRRNIITMALEKARPKLAFGYGMGEVTLRMSR